MNFPKYTKRTEKLLACAFYFFVLFSMAVFALLQPFGVPPDEANRYKVVQYICIHGVLPVGSDPEILIGEYGASYAFQPILSYIIMGYCIRPIFLRVQNSFLLLYTARFINVFIGLIMAYFVRKISKELFDKPSLQWIFSLLVVFLPQNIFLHSYVNTDSMAALSSAIIIYACIRGMQTIWNKSSCITLSIGIILCALSYYNAYGVILCSIFVFLFSFYQGKMKKPAFLWKDMLHKGIFISVLVLLGISWWFIRNALLYNGDFLGMTARMKCAIETCLPQFHPDTKVTIQNSGHSLLYLFRETTFLHTLYESFIATFGTMDIFTLPFVYKIYKWIFLFGFLCLWIRPEANTTVYLPKVSKRETLFFDVIMILDMIIVAGLCIWYSYSWDYQPQGRYILPLLIPLAFFISIGIAKLDCFLINHVANGKQISSIIQYCVMISIIISLIATMFFAVIPYYQTHLNWLVEAFRTAPSF